MIELTYLTVLIKYTISKMGFNFAFSLIYINLRLVCTLYPCNLDLLQFKAVVILKYTFYIPLLSNLSHFVFF